MSLDLNSRRLCYQPWNLQQASLFLIRTILRRRLHQNLRRRHCNSRRPRRTSYTTFYLTTSWPIRSKSTT